MNSNNQRLVLIGNGFDLAHGLKTSYTDFINWYFSEAFNTFIHKRHFEDALIEFKYNYAGYYHNIDKPLQTVQEVIYWCDNTRNVSLTYKSKFFEGLIKTFTVNNWVNIECYYFNKLKKIFTAPNINTASKLQNATLLNTQFDYLIKRLSEYFLIINDQISSCKKILTDSTRLNLRNAFIYDNNSKVTFLNFNYTDTLLTLAYANANEIIHIHGKASNSNIDQIVFGYGDETDPVYQQIEDSGENVYLNHLKSFWYFQTNVYSKMISIIDAAKYDVYIVGHSCGLSDRVLLNEIFEHDNCNKINIFYHARKDGTDNFKEITQEISRHFRPQNKNLMRRRINPKDPKNIIPQFTSDHQPAKDQS